VTVLTVLVDEAELLPPLRGLCAGYEQERWRAEELARSMMEHLPDFALSFTERREFNSATGVRLMRRAAQTVYATEKYHRRGEFGELLLHMVLSEAYGTEPAISKMFFKDASNDTVKGFDSVHVAQLGQELELWLGEVKFYDDLDRAIRDVVDELRKHAERDYLRAEFLAIMNKIDDSWPHAAAMKSLLDEDTSLDTVFARLRIPVLLTYDSSTVSGHTSYADPYRERFKAEVLEGHQRFNRRDRPEYLIVHLILVPLASKQRLVDILHAQLTAWQTV
jgi:hypothetical protein